MLSKKQELIHSVQQRFAVLRKHLGLSKKKFAEELRVSPAHITGVESGKSTPSRMLIRLVALVFRANEDWILTGEGPMLLAHRIDSCPEDPEVLNAIADPTIRKAAILMTDLDQDEKIIQIRHLEEKRRLKELEKKLNEMQELLGRTG